VSVVLRLRDARYRYAGAASPALSGVSLEIARGEVIALSGAPGSGTTTLLLVAGGYAPRLTGGELIGERDLHAHAPAIVFAAPWTQLTGLCQTVSAEIAFGPACHAQSREHIRAVVQRQLERLGIAHLAERDPATLSGGELQRVIVASALALEPDLLLLDDPAAELDPAAADSLYALLPNVAAEGVAVLVATPDTARAAHVASRAIVLEAGRIVFDGPAERVPA
jgi:energy-coupling factor transporter ATP-binding protein EcfA2